MFEESYVYHHTGTVTKKNNLPEIKIEVVMMGLMKGSFKTDSENLAPFKL